eukprot:3269405-Prorocentrum_lima.AAC.1
MLLGEIHLSVKEHRKDDVEKRKDGAALCIIEERAQDGPLLFRPSLVVAFTVPKLHSDCPE